MQISPLAAASWIWKRPDESPSVDLYLCFRREWIWSGEPGEEAWADLSVDSDFVFSLNGVEVGRGQFPDFPEEKSWSRFDVRPYLKKGINVVALLVFYRGEGFSDYALGPGGMIFGLQAGSERLVSDSRWRYARHAGFRSGVAERVTGQAGYTFRYDAREEENWMLPGFDDRGWSPVAVMQERWQGGPVWQSLVERPLPPLLLGEGLPVSIVAQGRIVPVEAMESTSVAVVMAGRALQPLSPMRVFGERELSRLPERSSPFPDAGEWLTPGKGKSEGRGPLSITLEGGWYLMVDLGAQAVGFLTLEVTAEAGTVLDIAHGEHLDDGRVRISVDGRQFADRYICGAGRRSFEMPFRRIGARYLEVHGSAPVQLHAITLRPVASDCRRVGEFQTGDPFAHRLHEVAVRTLELCRHDHFEDCPWRERALYAFDGRLQALFGYYAFGDYRFAEVSLTLLGKSYCGKDGLLSLTAPGRRGSVIPGFSFHWICAVAEHWLFSGQANLFERFHPVIRGILHHAFERYDAASGLYEVPGGTPYWHFYEWSDGLSGETDREEQARTRHAPYQLLLLAAARSYQWMLEQKGAWEEAQAVAARLDALRAAFRRTFVCDGAIASFQPGNGDRHEMVQALAALEGLGEGSERTEGSTPAMLASLYFTLKAVSEQAPDRLPALSARLQAIWERMLFSGATSLWETAEGARDFCNAGSLCHGWSALPVYYHQALVLGVTPLEPGFRRFLLQIYPDRFLRASGAIPTPAGIIRIAWERSGEGLVITASGPEECQPQLEMFPGHNAASFSYNGAELLLCGV